MLKLVALAAIALGAAAPAPQEDHEGPDGRRRGGCPPPRFDSARNFSLARYTSAPWYAIEALPVSYMPPSQLFCVRATYVLKDDGSAVEVYHESRKGGTKGKPPSKPDMVMHPDDLPYATKHHETSASKLRLGPRCYDFLYNKCSAEAEAAFEEARLSADVDDLLPAAATGGHDTSKLIMLFKAILFKPYWVVYVDDDYEWAITTSGPPHVPSDGLCTTCRMGGHAGVFLLHRDAEPSVEVQHAMRKKARELGLDTTVLQKVTQTDCDYTPTCELTEGHAPWCSGKAAHAASNQKRQQHHAHMPTSVAI